MHAPASRPSRWRAPCARLTTAAATAVLCAACAQGDRERWLAGRQRVIHAAPATGDLAWFEPDPLEPRRPGLPAHGPVIVSVPGDWPRGWTDPP